MFNHGYHVYIPLARDLELNKHFFLVISPFMFDTEEHCDSTKLTLLSQFKQNFESKNVTKIYSQMKHFLPQLKITIYYKQY